MANIYLVRSNSYTQGSLQLKPPHTPSRRIYSNSKRESSFSTSKKTEPKYAHLYKNTSFKKQNDQQPQQIFHQIPRRMQRVNIEKSDYSVINPCSSIQMTDRIVFNRVAQANIRENSLFFRINNNSNKLMFHKKCQIIRKEYRQPKRDQSKKQQQSQVNSSESYSQMQGMYILQPNRQIFFCRQCLLYLPIIQIKSHVMQCRSPKSYQHFLDRWERVTQLLQQGQLQSSSVFRLTELMQLYAKNRPINNGSMLYSQELTRILNYRLIVDSNHISIPQLFEIIQKIGDKLESINRNDSFWGMCS